MTNALQQPLLRPIGIISSALTSRDEAPKQGDEGAPDAWLEVYPWATAGLDGLSVGDEIIVVTWLHQADRDVFHVHPRSEPEHPLTGVFATRSPDRPNPLGLHPVVVHTIDGNRVRIGPIEAVDGTPVVDIKPVLTTKCPQGAVPMLSYENGVAALEWLATAFGFRERTRMLAPDGRLAHGEMETGDGVIMLATPSPDYEGPKRHREHCARCRRWSAVPWVVDGVLVHVDDVDRHYEQAKNAGATILTEPESGFPGRRYRAEDLEGHRWMFMQLDVS